jgi:hypothetical protein
MPWDLRKKFVCFLKKVLTTVMMYVLIPNEFTCCRFLKNLGGCKDFQAYTFSTKFKFRK